MAEQVIFGKTSKRINSISQQFTPVITTNVLLKEPCSIVAPVFLLKQPYATLRECNYCSYAGFYYYITDVISVRNRHVEVHCSRDALASFSNDIKNAYGYYSYADETHWDNHMDDNRMNPDTLNLNLATKSRALFGNQFLFDKDGTIIIKTFSMGGLTQSSVKTWALTWDDFINLAFSLNNVIINELNNLQNVEDILRKIGQAVFGGDVKDNILDCYWTPTRYARLNAISKTNLIIGAYKSAVVNAKLLPDIDDPFTTTDDASDILTQNIFDDYPLLRDPRFTSLQLKHPCGTIEIEAEEFKCDPTLNVHLTYNYLTGDYIVSAYGSKDDYNRAKCYGQASGSLRMDLLGILTSKGTTLTSFAGSMAKMAGTLIASKAIAAATTSSTTTNNVTTTTMKDGTTITSATEQITDSTSTTHNTGISGVFNNYAPQISTVNLSLNEPGMMALYTDMTDPAVTKFYLVCTSSYPNIIKDNKYSDFCNRYGWPCNRYIKPGDVTSGAYVKGEGVSVAITGATQTELSTINSNLNAGIYIEP